MRQATHYPMTVESMYHPSFWGSGGYVQTSSDQDPILVWLNEGYPLVPKHLHVPNKIRTTLVHSLQANNNYKIILYNRVIEFSKTCLQTTIATT